MLRNVTGERNRTQTLECFNVRPVSLTVRRLLVLLCAGSIGCTRSLSTAMDGWIGATDTDLVSAWGAPDRSESVSDGGKVLTWRHSYTTVSQSHAVCEQSFTVSAAGRVTRWATHGCPSRVPK